MAAARCFGSVRRCSSTFRADCRLAWSFVPKRIKASWNWYDVLSGAISLARVRRLYYGAADPKGGAVESGVRFFASPTCHHVPEVYGAVGETEAATLLKEFFKVRR